VARQSAARPSLPPSPAPKAFTAWSTLKARIESTASWTGFGQALENRDNDLGHRACVGLGQRNAKVLPNEPNQHAGHNTESQNMTDRTIASSEVISFTGVRVTHQSPLGFDQVLSNLRARVGQTTVANIVELGTEPGSTEAFEEKVQKYVGESGFMLFAQIDHGRWIGKYGVKRRLVRWIFGNPVVAITLIRHDPTAGLFAPVELLLAEDDDGVGCSVTYVRPSSLIAIGGNPELLTAAESLDAKMEALIASSVADKIAAMGATYRVKWIPKDGNEPATHHETFENGPEAMTFACSILEHDPLDIWVENEFGDRIDRPKILEHCLETGNIKHVPRS
jgi:uncharacterized protein (DUF302 family)